MSVNYILSQYIDTAMYQATYDKLEDDSFVGRIPCCKGVIAFAATLSECDRQLRSTLEDWILVGLKLGHSLPVINNINLNESQLVSRWTPCKRRDFVKKLRQLEFDGSFSGNRHQFMVFDENRYGGPASIFHGASRIWKAKLGPTEVDTIDDVDEKPNLVIYCLRSESR